MAIKILIRRNVPEKKAREMIPLFRKMRTLANEQPGYITGETMRNLEKPDEFLVISTWETSDDWKRWVQSCWAAKQNTRSFITGLRSNTGSKLVRLTLKP
jgi:heme-degrading monooxygenase HmoA